MRTCISWAALITCTPGEIREREAEVLEMVDLTDREKRLKFG